MAVAKILRIYLDDTLRLRAERGNFNVLNKIEAVFRRGGYRVELCRNTPAERMKSATRQGYSLFHMDAPFHDRSLTLRKAYFYPFWRVEKTAERWKFEIAQSGFDPEQTDPVEAKRFCDTRRRTLFPDFQPDIQPDSTVFIPLQGNLLERRSFQSESPLDMIRLTLLHDPVRQIVAGLHPGQTYLPEELDALRKLADAQPRLRISTEPVETLLPRCDYVVTENSSVALFGYFLHKPAVLFAKIDFHHIAANVCEMGAENALKSAPKLRPDFDRYMHWFLRDTALNGGSADVEARIAETFRKHGWNI